MSDDARRLFIGGPEDGLYHVIPSEAEIWDAPERLEPIFSVNDSGIQSRMVEFKKFTYIKRGESMWYQK